MSHIDQSNSPSILLVDDEPKNLELLANILQKEGYRVEFALNGKEALSWVMEESFDLILLDIMMPEMDGFEVCKKLKENVNTRDISVIFLTAKLGTADLIKGFEVGCVDYVNKPFNMIELTSRVRTHIELQQNKMALIEKNQLQNELLHILSHDLTSSIGPILGTTELIRMYPEKCNDYADNIALTTTNSLQLLDVIKNLLYAEEKSLNLAPVDLKKMFDQAIYIIQEKLEAKEVTIDMDIPDQVEVIAEEVTLRNSVLINLLTNAIKFSTRGSTIKIYSKQDGDQCASVRIIDSGIGMPAKLIANLFDITKMTNRKGTEDERGTGFGMPLVQKFMNRYGGSIKVTSKSIEEFPEDHGTEICLIFQR